MSLPKRGEKGFTLIELLIVVAILGVLAAVIIPNVGRFMGRGEAEARRTERRSVEAAVIAMMSENGITSIPNPQDFTGRKGSIDRWFQKPLKPQRIFMLMSHQLLMKLSKSAMAQRSGTTVIFFRTVLLEKTATLARMLLLVLMPLSATTAKSRITFQYTMESPLRMRSSAAPVWSLPMS